MKVELRLSPIIAFTICNRQDCQNYGLVQASEDELLNYEKIKKPL